MKKAHAGIGLAPDTVPHAAVAGIGLRSRASAADVLTLLDHCLHMVALDRGDLVALATLEAKRRHPAMVAAAAQLRLPILAVDVGLLRADVPNPSEYVERHLGVHSVAEATAMHFGSLLLEKQRGQHVTCALAQLTAGYVLPSCRAATAASTLSTSWAGP